MKPETLQALKDERADLARQLMTLDSAIEILAGVSDTGFAVTPALQAAVMRAKPVLPKETKRTKEGKPKAGNHGPMVARRARYIEAIGKCGETFSVEEVIERGKLDIAPKVVSANFTWWTQKGILQVADKGGGRVGNTWRRGLGWRNFAGVFHVEHSEAKAAKAETRRKGKRAPAAPAPAMPTPSLPHSPTPRLSRTAGKHGQSPQATALEALFAGLSGAYSGPEIVELVRKHWPDLVDKDSKVSDLRVRLMDMFTAGKIRRTGIGADARFSAMPGRPPTAADDDDLKISVPRDPDVGGGK